MKTNSNINIYYEALVRDLVERAKLIDSDLKKSGEEYDEYEAVNRAVSDGFIYGADEAYVVAKAMIEGIVTWGEDIVWEEVYEMLLNDVSEEYSDNGE